MSTAQTIVARLLEDEVDPIADIDRYANTTKCPECHSTNLSPPDDEGLIDCMGCGIWFNPFHPRNAVAENDEGAAAADDFLDREVLNKPLPKKIEIWGKRWNSRASGYHRAHVYVDDKLVHVSGLNYGSSDQYVQTGMEFLIDNFYIPRPPRRYAGTIWLRELGIPYEIHGTDVKRERDTL